MSTGTATLSVSQLESRICIMREVPVLLDTDLAVLYGVATGALMQAVRRNRQRFPADFMFQLTNQELRNLKSQSVISSLQPGYGRRRSLPSCACDARHWSAVN